MTKLNDYIFIARAFGAVCKLAWSLVRKDSTKLVCSVVSVLCDNEYTEEN